MTAIQKAKKLRNQAITLLFIEREQIAERLGQLHAGQRLPRKGCSSPVALLGALGIRKINL
jgi:hypothetical protein